MMEGLTTRLAVSRLSNRETQQLERLHAEMQDAYKAADDREPTQANARWHMVINEACGSRFLVDLVRRLWMPFHWAGQWVDPQRGLSVIEHGLVMEAIRDRDSDRAALLMQEHIERVQQSIFDGAAAEE